MQLSIMNAYNQANLAFSPLVNAPPQPSLLVSGLQKYVSSGAFYQGAGTYVPLTIPVGNFIQEMMLTGNVSGSPRPWTAPSSAWPYGPRHEPLEHPNQEGFHDRDLSACEGGPRTRSAC